MFRNRDRPAVRLWRRGGNINATRHWRPMPATLLTRLDAGDRALYARWAVATSARRSTRMGWTLCTHLGGATSTVTAAAAPLAGSGLVRETAARALLALVLSHLVVQLLKRRCTRLRPSSNGGRPLVGEPDRYSFPSGHATAALAVGLTYALAFPALAVPLVLLALGVGYSRVALGVHYPGDVLVGQVVAVGAVLVV